MSDISKQQAAKHLVSLNRHIHKIQRDNPSPRTDEIENIISEGYNVKNDVMMKMIQDGAAKITSIQTSSHECYAVVRVSRHITFHFPIEEINKRGGNFYENYAVTFPTKGKGAAAA